MQLYPPTQDIMPSDTVAAAPEMVPNGGTSGAQTFTIVYRKATDGALWKVDVVSDNAMDAAWAVVYDQNIDAGLIVGAIVKATLR